MTTLPDGLLAAWYGDDFTGAAATMEVFAFAGLDAVLFLDRPTPAQLARFKGARGIGIAGIARAKSPDWMADNLPPIFADLAALKAPISFYKVCSTFDSSPQTGSVGCAVDLARETFRAPWVPMLVAAPPIGRWQVFGNLFAAAPSGTFRLDRHPVMARHPVTPMAEADLARHLGAQTTRPVGLIDLPSLMSAPDTSLAQCRRQADIISIDAVDEASLAAAGRLIWQNREPGQFAVGSQGILYALIAHWRSEGMLDAPGPVPGAGHTDRIVAISGSASTVTRDQITWATGNGFHPIPFDAAQVVDAAALAKAEEATVAAALAAAGDGKAPLIFSAAGPDDPAIARLTARAEEAGLPLGEARARIGAALGRMLRSVLMRTGYRRAIISGGDTSGYAAAELGIYALTALAPTIPAAALCKGYSQDPAIDGLELALKGGQMGAPDYFGAIRAGGGTT